MCFRKKFFFVLYDFSHNISSVFLFFTVFENENSRPASSENLANNTETGMFFLKNTPVSVFHSSIKWFENFT